MSESDTLQEPSRVFKRDQIWARTLIRLDKSASVLLSREQRLPRTLPASATRGDSESREIDEVWRNRIKARWYGDEHTSQH